MNVDILEESFDLVAPRGDELVAVFYGNLFVRAPHVRSLFAHVEMKKQRAMLLAALVLLRESLRDLDAIVPKLRELGARHVAYGATPEAYPIVGEVLIATMAQVAGSAWRDEYGDAWAEVYGVVQAAMLDGAAQAGLAEAA
ncbi:MAG TPA: globin domain-containing protein [Gaiellaceae bacterium]|nr:globin domain-containing protein [Gaiellaceae bacterium]